VDITRTEVTSSYEEIGNNDGDDYDDDSNHYSIELLLSNDLSPTAMCPFRETAQLTNTSNREQKTGHMNKQINKEKNS
jgi:hypothetical protein